MGVFWWTDFVFAGDLIDRTWAQFLTEMYLTFTIIIKLLSWFWVILANIAGGLLTNGLVTGDWFWLTETLYGYHKFFQNIAWIILVAILLKSIITDAVLSYKPEALVGCIKNWFVASIGIYFSRWAITLLVSFASVVFVAISDLWNNIIKTNPAALEKIQIATPYSNTFDYSKTDKNPNTSKETTTDNNTNILNSICKLYSISQTKTPDQQNTTISIDKLLPTADNLVGPLMYFGYGIFRFNSIAIDSPFDPKTDANIGKICDNLKTWWVPSESDLQTILWTSTEKAIKDRLMSLLIMLLNIVTFSLALLVMVVANFLRILFIWIILAFAPLIVLSRVFKKSFWWDASKIFDDIWAKSIWSIVWLIFQPAISIFWLCVAMFFINGMYSTFTRFQTDDEKQIASTTNATNTNESIDWSQISFWQWWSINIKWKLFNDAAGDIGGGFWYIMMSVMTIYILFMIIKVSNSFNEATWRFTQDIMKLWSKFIFDQKLPFLGWASIWAITWADGRKDSLKSNFLKPITDNLETNKKKDEDKLRRRFSGFFGIEVKDIDSGSASDAKSAILKWKISTDKDNEAWIELLKATPKGIDSKIDKQLKELKESTFKWFKALKKSIDTDMKWQEFTFKNATNAKEVIEQRFLNWWAIFMKHAYKLDIKDDDLKDPSKLKVILNSKNVVWSFINKMLTKEEFAKQFENSSFNTTSWNWIKFENNWAKIESEDKKAIWEIKFTGGGK